MKSLKNKIVTMLQASMLSVITLLLYRSASFADGKNPYGPHKPIDTGIESLGLVYIAAGVLFLVGVAFIVYGSYFKDKLVSRKKDE